LNYTYNEAELLTYRSLTVDKYVKTQLSDFSGNKPSFVPAQILNLWTIKEFTNGIGVGIGCHYVSNQFVHVDNDYEIEEYIQLNASLFYKFSKGSWRINVKNITNESIFTRGFGPYSIIPSQPLTLYVTVSLLI